MVTHRLFRLVQVRRTLGGLLMVVLATMMSVRAAIATDAVAVPPGGWTLRPGCDETCGLWHVSGEVYEPQPPAVASPEGTTYSVSHRVGADLDGTGPQSTTCFFINNPLLPGTPDDIVTFNAVAEPIRTDLFGTVPIVSESDTAQPSGRRLVVITTQSQPGTDLFPSGFMSGAVPLKDACFSIGLDDPLTWAGTDTIDTATLEFLTDGVTMAGPFDAISFFTVPWNGVVTIALPNGTGHGFNGVRLTLMTQKSINLPNDGCRGQIEVTDGDTEFSTIGATTDGPDEPATCRFSSYSDIGSDIWYRYAATCDGNLTVDLCNSNYDTKLAVYDGCGQCPVSSPPLECNDDSFCGLRSYVTVPAVLGHCYTIRIGGYLAVQGTGTMRVSCDVIAPPSGACCDNGNCFATLTEADCEGQNGAWFEGNSCPSFVCPITPPSNDACTDCARVLTGVPYHGRTQAATGTDISSCGDNDTLDVWNCWTADCTGRVSITTCGSLFDTTLAVYDACGGHELACDDDGCPLSPGLRSMVTLDVTEGTTYSIRVAGYNGASGNYTLNVEPCRNACCLQAGLCGFTTSAQCEAVGGTFLGPGSACLGDLDDNGMDDACERNRGSCCDGTDGQCIDGVFREDCAGDQEDWLKSVACADRDPLCREPTGACCDLLTGGCSNDVPGSMCAGVQQTWTKGATCGDIVCQPVTGACCDRDPFGGCTDGVTRAECDCASCEWMKLVQCADIECTLNSIPTLSVWGLAILSLMFLIAAKIRFGRVRHSEPTA